MDWDTAQHAQMQLDTDDGFAAPVGSGVALKCQIGLDVPPARYTTHAMYRSSSDGLPSDRLTMATLRRVGDGTSTG